MSESSRIFINGLPPSLTEEEFKKHFAAKSPITDAKLIPHRRIGYVGYKTPEDAKAAAKYFNKTFIRMSRIGVELARAIKDETLPPSRKQQREIEREAAKKRAEENARDKEERDIKSLKRKRAQADMADPKLQEFLEVMAPVSKTKLWTSKGDELEEPPVKVAAIEIPEDESDEEYEMVPKKARVASPQPEPLVTPIAAPAVSATTGANTNASVVPTARHTVEEVVAKDVLAEDADEPMMPPSALDDDDWLKSRTNRLLDLVDDQNEAIRPAVAAATAPAVADTVMADAPAPTAAALVAEKSATDSTAQNTETLAGITITGTSSDATIDEIKKNGRLFVRNLPYTATEDDLKAHFEKYGALEEVCLTGFHSICRKWRAAFVMNIQIGTAYATASDVNWSEILVDAPFVLKTYQNCLFCYRALREPLADTVLRSTSHSTQPEPQRASSSSSTKTSRPLPKHSTSSMASPFKVAYSIFFQLQQNARTSSTSLKSRNFHSRNSARSRRKPKPRHQHLTGTRCT